VSKVSRKAGSAEARLIESRLGYQFKQPELLIQALTHRSYSANHYERLEFLGDAVLNLAISQLLFEGQDRFSEGQLSRIRANLVNQVTLAQVAEAQEFGRYLRLGTGELKSGGRSRPSILADVVEAVIGALFLDGGFDIALSAAAAWFQPYLNDITPSIRAKDAKTRLQEFLQSKRRPLPEYRVTHANESGQGTVFVVECFIPHNNLVFSSQGLSRKVAEQSAAEQALEVLTNQYV